MDMHVHVYIYMHVIRMYMCVYMYIYICTGISAFTYFHIHIASEIEAGVAPFELEAGSHGPTTPCERGLRTPAPVLAGGRIPR